MRRLIFPFALLLWFAYRRLRRAQRRSLGVGDVVAITGASRGLGLELAGQLAARGCRLAICARDADKLRSAEELLAALGAEVLAVPTDVRDRASAEAFVEATVRRFGRIDVLVNNAGVLSMGPADALGLAAFEDSQATMFWGPLYTTLAALPSMRAQGTGVVVNVSSIGGRVATPNLLPYSSAKFAVLGLSEGLHAELAREGIHVLTVIPGFMRTGSPYNAMFAGRERYAFALFNILGNLPPTSTSAAYAARRIVEAIDDREAEVVIGNFARLVARGYGLAPGVTARILALLARALPRAAEADADELRSGWESRSAVSESFLTRDGQEAARQLQQAG